MRRIVPVETLNAGKIRGALQDGNREFITLLACISAAGERMPLALIYQSDAGDMQDTWLEDFNGSDYAYFGLSPTGWTSNDHGIQWLHRFHAYTRGPNDGIIPKSLLIIDGHASHVSKGFIDFAMANSILIVIFPPHSTHVLQPLDVGIFSPLSIAYS
jgi:DDE superfamily endonuclease